MEKVINSGCFMYTNYEPIIPVAELQTEPGRQATSRTLLHRRSGFIVYYDRTVALGASRHLSQTYHRIIEYASAQHLVLAQFVAKGFGDSNLGITLDLKKLGYTCSRGGLNQI